MLHRKLFRFSLFSFTLLLYPFIHPADQRKDAGAPIPGAQYVGSLPNGHGTTEIAPTANMPKGPDINPQYGGQPNSSGKNSSAGGLFGFLWNLGKKSEREIRRDDEIAKMDKILSKAASGISLSPEEYAFTGAGKMTLQPSIPVAAPVQTPAPAPTVTAPTPTPEHSYPQNTQFASIAGVRRAGITCMPQVGSEVNGMAIPWEQPPLPSTPTAQQPSMIDKPNFPQFNFKNPPSMGGGIPLPSNNGNGSNGGNGFVQGVGGLMAGGGAAYTLSTTVAAPTAATVTTTTGGGVAVTTGGGWISTVLVPVLPWVAGTAAVTAGCIAGIDYFFPSEHNIFFKERAHKIIADRALKSQGSSSSTTGGNGNNGKDPKERKFNSVQKTDAFRKIKENYQFDKQTKSYKLKDHGNPIINSKTGKPVERVYWDNQHGDIEAWKGVNRGDHLGSLDPETFEMYKGPDLKRSIL